MRTSFRASFARDLRDIKEAGIRRRVADKIEEVEQASDLSQIRHVKKLQGTGSFYRFRVGEYRIGAELEGDTVVFVRCLNRKEIYRFFP
jgi:mRNA interferase RelE/StbE